MSRQLGAAPVTGRPLSSVRVAQVATVGTPMDLFAGIPVRRYEEASAWYERLLGSEPSFLPHATEAVWEVAEHRFLFIVERPEHAGHTMHTILVGDLDAMVAQIAARGIEPAKRETYSTGVRKVTYRDPDGNEVGLGGVPPPAG